jgi:hypothetical protein
MNTKKLFSIALVAISFVLIIIYVYKSTKDNWYHQGLNAGHISARYEIINALKIDFTKISSHKKYKVIFTLKTTEVVIYKKNNIKTVGIIE